MICPGEVNTKFSHFGEIERCNRMLFGVKPNTRNTNKEEKKKRKNLGMGDAGAIASGIDAFPQGVGNLRSFSTWSFPSHLLFACFLPRHRARAMAQPAQYTCDKPGACYMQSRLRGAWSAMPSRPTTERPDTRGGATVLPSRDLARWALTRCQSPAPACL